MLSERLPHGFVEGFERLEIPTSKLIADLSGNGCPLRRGDRTPPVSSCRLSDAGDDARPHRRQTEGQIGRRQAGHANDAVLDA
ncbi:hypothetical protein PS928_03502 [Pseudomonas fluorescens]|uniref:Uncharacterized protein n=1 Tax=Pseudomonas fluorescens TaxID=294 RepID=A0A5E7UGJ4_PSEFL|nr:hypothetical protein PS928_03502 [Pseudomonas fluorescens]